MCTVRARKKANEVVQWTGTQESIEKIKKLGTGSELVYLGKSNALYFRPLNRPNKLYRVEINDWIVKGGNGEVYRFKSDIFEKVFDVVEDDAVL